VASRKDDLGNLFAMTLVLACIWGAIGALAVEAAELYGAMRRVKNFTWRIEGELPLGPYLFTVVLRLALGAFAAAVCQRTGPVGPVAAAAAGVAGVKIVEELGRMGGKTSPPALPPSPEWQADVAEGRSAMPPKVPGPRRDEGRVRGGEGGPFDAAQ
jgi:hypothetical protein